MHRKSLLLSINNLNVKFGENFVLEDFDFELYAGEMVAVLGANGAGKTTLFKAILSLIPYRGNVKFLGERVEKNYLKIGYVPQKFYVDANLPLTVKEFLRFSALDAGSRADDVLAEVGMGDFGNALLGRLSGGQLQRVLIARALINDPKLMLLDEPTAGIDEAGERSFYQIVEHLHSSHNVTVMMISHDAHNLSKRAGRILQL